jgi:hypothetical protein
MEESYVEGVAAHNGPESCGVTRKGGVEAGALTESTEGTPLPEQGRWLGQVVRGYLAYHAVPTNSRKITSFQYHVTWHRRRALSRRSQKGQVTWGGWGGSPRVGCHPPGSAIPGRNTASSSNTRGGEPSALAAHARIFPGGAG